MPDGSITPHIKTWPAPGQEASLSERPLLGERVFRLLSIHVKVAHATYW